jgi:hypothetical protein
VGIAVSRDGIGAHVVGEEEQYVGLRFLGGVEEASAPEKRENKQERFHRIFWLGSWVFRVE